MQKKIRLKDVAERAGVAVNTASTILNRRPNSWASKETEERVFKAAKELNYRPNKAARALRSGSYQTIGILVQDLTNPFYASLVETLSRVAEEHNYDLLIQNCRSSIPREERLLEELKEIGVDGSILCLSDNEKYRDELVRHSQTAHPVVALGSGIPTLPLLVDSILSDFSFGLEEGIKQLRKLGHQHFVFLHAISEGVDDGDRTTLVREFLNDSEIPDGNVTMLNCGPTIDSAYQVFAEYLKKNISPRPTALIAMNDLSAFGGMRAAVEAGLKIPQDLSVVGVDDVPFSSYSYVSLSSVRQRYEKICRTAIEMLISRLDKNSSDNISGPRQVVFPTHFVARESIGPAAS
ncbi:LacI family DNA-binding transcriptional regulator [Roseibacillus persicicus]|uniref:LacI family DNA-binding transcriptional regulator n=1 Tax=Roseibacillus persicicus TaxID=454148 RepID=UPI00280F6946|nr:LacI family DNA-binding transcriptional regulator [Roseibacillus persicicus]MDQ8188965.1 LacI family DNA-binding transcriptional regulator [Roseibacillus persicicus]